MIDKKITISAMPPVCVKEAFIKYRQTLIEEAERESLKKIDPKDPDADFQRKVLRDFATDLVDHYLAEMPIKPAVLVTDEELGVLARAGESEVTAAIAENAVRDMKSTRTGVLGPADYKKAIEERLASYDAQGLLRYDVEASYDGERKVVTTTIRSRIDVVVRQVGDEP